MPCSYFVLIHEMQELHEIYRLFAIFPSDLVIVF